MRPQKNCLSIFLSLILICVCSRIEASEWLNLKDKHFVMYYNFKEDTSFARHVLRKAEGYYRSIALLIDYSRYSNFWTWEERVKIIIFPDQKSFVQNTGQPAWSRGYANSHSKLFRSRIIVTYRQEYGFLEGLLPHEISHLILRDFIGFNQFVPIWFDEGVAQLKEKDRKVIARQIMEPLAQRKQYIPFTVLFNMDVRKVGDFEKVKIFYLQSLSVIDFLIKKYGRSAFGRLCRKLKANKNFEEALRQAYPHSFDSISQLEDKWVSYMSR